MGDHVRRLTIGLTYLAAVRSLLHDAWCYMDADESEESDRLSAEIGRLMDRVRAKAAKAAKAGDK